MVVRAVVIMKMGIIVVLIDGIIVDFMLLGRGRGARVCLRCVCLTRIAFRWECSRLRAVVSLRLEHVLASSRVA